MINLRAWRLLHLARVCGIVVFALASLSTLLESQTQCGYSNHEPTCPGYCGPNYQFSKSDPTKSPKNAYTVLLSINCGPSCGWLAYLVAWSTCYPPSTTNAMNEPQVAEHLYALSNGKQLLVPECGGGFIDLREAQGLATHSQTAWEVPKALPLRF